MMRHPRLSLTIAAALCAAAAPAATAGPYINREFPDFTATDAITGKRFSLSDLRGGPVLIDFWATWCGPCIRELPNVQKMHREYGDQGLQIVSISLDRDEKRFRTFVEKSGMDWIHVMEGGGWSTRLVGKYGVRSIPTMYLLDANGVCVAERPRGAVLEQVIRQAMGAAGAPAPDGFGAVRPGALTAQARGAKVGLINELLEARDQVQATAAPLQELSSRLEGMSRVVYQLQRFLPRGESHVSQSRLDQLRGDLAATRHELFMLGLIGDEQAVVLPSVEAPASRQLESSTAAIERMGVAVDAARSQLRLLAARIGGLQRDVVRGRSGDDVLEARISRLGDEVLRVSESWCEPWLDQLDAADRMIAGLGPGGAALQREAAAIRRELAARLAEGGDLESLRLRFSRLIEQAMAARETGAAAGP